MKKIAYSLLSIAVAFLSFSCAKNMEAELVNEEVNQPTVHTFICEFAQPDTKFAIANDGKTKWEKGDKILIHAGNDGNEREIIELEEADILNEGKTAVIKTTLDPYIHTSGGVQDYTSTYYAIYPASATVSPTDTPYTFQNKSLYYETRVENFSEPALAACDDGEGKFLFYNLFGVISYSVTGDFDSVVFSGNSEETVGYNVYQCRIAKKSSGSMYLDWFKYGNGVKATDVVENKTAEFSVNANGTATNYICIPRGVNFGSGFTMKFYKEGNFVKFLKTNTAINLERNKFLPLGNITDDIHDYVPPSHSEHKSAITDAIDISAQQANCYVITTPGAYKFPALKGETDTAVGEVFDVELLWETYNNAEVVTENSVIAAVDFEDNWIYFKTPETKKPGNAVIAAKNDQGKIIWSWHIWIPSTTITETSATLFGAPAMSRNLGALVDALGGDSEDVPESGGLFYQYGRKDPFIGGSSFDVSQDYGCTKVTTSKPLAGASGTQISIAESIANPTLFTFNGETAAPETYDGQNWCTSNDDHWGGSSVKTMYDPCPAGYKVPARDKTLPIWANDGSSSQYGTDWTCDYEKHWFKKESVVFPHAGYLDDCDGGLNYSGSRNKLWFGTSASDKSAYCVYAKKNQIQLTSTHKASGASVRCVKMVSE